MESSLKFYDLRSIIWERWKDMLSPSDTASPVLVTLKNVILEFLTFPQTPQAHLARVMVQETSLVLDIA